MLGVNKGEVKLVENKYSQWNSLYLEEKETLDLLIGNYVKDIQHIGSTAIRSILAKPILDILVGVESLSDIQQFDTNVLKEEGYYHLSKVEIEGKEVFAKFFNLNTMTKSHILHIVEYKGEWWQQHTFFRDYLNNNPQMAKEYEALKKTLAIKYPNNVSAYSDEKNSFVAKVLSQRQN
ncbi:GrpB family protein [Cytobacillus sp. Hm23]